MVKDIIIVGGGAAGLMAGALATERGLKVLILEKNQRCGSKLLITGKGRCNITNTFEWKEFSKKINNPSFFKTAFYHFSNQDVIEFFNKIGLETKEERGSRIFPLSDRSTDVRDALLNFILSGGGEVEVGCQVQEVGVAEGNVIVKGNGGAESKILSAAEGREDGGGIAQLYEVKSSNFDGAETVHQGRNLMVATGGLSYPLTGSTGDGYKFAEAFGHNITNLFPSLTALKPENYDKGLVGVSLKNVKLDLLTEGVVRQSEFGELAFTNGGIEGALGFRLSRKAVVALMSGSKVELSLDLKPAIDAEDIEKRILNERRGGNLSNVLRSFLPGVLITPFLKAHPNLMIRDIPSTLKGWRFRINDYVGYERCVITAGGVDLKGVSRKTMESKNHPKLYFIGEILDLDGSTGGYNLQIAFSTAALAVENVVRNI